MTLLINGCSFTKCWNPSDEFIKKLGCNTVINLGKRGTGMQRAIRSTIEWIALNGNPDFVIIPIPLYSRWEMAVGKIDDEVDGTWISLQHPEYLNQDMIADHVSFQLLQNTIKNYYQLVPDIRTEWDKLFTEVIALSGFLSSRSIKHLIFDMCNGFEMIHINNYKGFEKINLINENENIIDLFKFCGNKFMCEKLPAEKTKNIHPLMHHHEKEGYAYLEKFIINYLNL